MNFLFKISIADEFKHRKYSVDRKVSPQQI